MSVISLGLLNLISLFGLGLALAAPTGQVADLLIPYSDSSKYGYVDLSGDWRIEPQFDFAGAFSEGLAPVAVGEKYGYIDESGQFVIEPQFSFAYPFVEGLAAASLENKAGFINRSGAFVIEPQFDFAASFSEGLAGVVLDGKGGYVDQSGSLVIAPQFDYTSDFSEELAAVGVAGKYGYIDRNGELVIEPVFDYAGDFAEGLAAVSLNDRTGYIDRSGTMVIEANLREGGPFSEGLAYVDTGQTTGYIDRTGKMVIEGPFNFGYEFSEGLAAVEVEGGIGFIDQKGRMVIDPRFVSVSAFKDGVAYVHFDDNTWGYIDRTGQALFQFPIINLWSDGQPTNVIQYLPAVPAETRAGSCWTNSLVTAIASAWRCSVGNSIFDPCLVADDGKTVVCGVDPTLDEPGFRLELTEPLPEPEVLPPAETTGPKLTLAALQNAEYLSDWYDDGKIKLTEGLYEEKYGEGATERTTTTLLKDYVAYGDLNFDGSEDAVVVLVTNGGGTGQFYETHVVLNEAGQPRSTASQPLGDRVIINSITIEFGVITIDMVTQGPTDGACCPTLPLVLKYELQDRQLVPANSAWLFRLADGATCSFATGATGEIEGKRLNYSCSDGSWILGGLQPGVTWAAEKATLSETDPFTTTTTAMTNISVIWEPVDPAEVSAEIGLAPEQVRLESGGIAQSIRGEIRPAVRYDPNVPPALNGEPAHLRFVFDEAVLPAWAGADLSQPQLLIYPTENYRAIYEAAGLTGVDERITTLEELLTNRPQTVAAEIPVLPSIEAAQVIRAQVNYLDFQGGSGVRFITHYAQDASPILSGQIVYTFQGLTTDGKYYIAYFHPIATTALPDTYEESEAAQDYNAFVQNMESYLEETTQTLNKLDSLDYVPNLVQLDAMLESLQVGINP
jgi:hypothetical protein